MTPSFHSVRCGLAGIQPVVVKACMHSEDKSTKPALLDSHVSLRKKRSTVVATDNIGGICKFKEFKLTI